MGWLLIYLTAVLDVISSIFIKEWVLHGKTHDLLIGIICLAFSGVSFAFSMKYFGLAVSNVLWNSFSTVFLAVVAVAIFHEKLSLMQIVGILVIVVGVVLVG